MPAVARLEAVLGELGTLAGGPVRVWRRTDRRMEVVAGEPTTWQPPAADGPAVGPAGPVRLAPVPGGAGLVLEVMDDRGPDAEVRAHAVAALAAELLRTEHEAAMLADELATRYEEIDLLYTIADILGRTVRLEEAAQVITRELADVVGARRASILVLDEASQTLRLVAGRGLETYRVEPIPVHDPRSIAARVFREQRMLAYDATSPAPLQRAGEERGYRGASFVSLPISYAPPGGPPRTIGVINLTDRIGEDSFTAGHRKLLVAIAAQVGAAFENARLVERERRRVRLDTELLLAHGLQMALMQPTSVLEKVADVAARTVPVESVGGDFYKVVSLRSGAVGVAIGDVSSHGLTAALLMAHAIAAAGVIVQTVRTPEQALERLLEVVGDELARAEMHLSLCYAVVDARRGVLRYANAGHPQAFVVPAAGEPVRLAATAPPLGLGTDRRIRGDRLPWTAGSDLLCCFSDGIPDTLGPGGEPYGEARVLATVQGAHALPTREIVNAVFAHLAAFAPGPAGDDRTLVCLRR